MTRILSPLALTLAIGLSTAPASTVGLWRFDEAGAAAGGAIVSAENTTAPGPLDALPSGGAPLYSDEVPATEIFDPVAGTIYANRFSFDAGGGSSQLLTADTIDFNSSFTVEFFIKLVGEPSSYHPFLQRNELADLSWQVDYDHAANQGFGRIRSRWDTPAGAPDGVAEAGIDENVNFVVGPQGNASAPKVFVDTGAKDELGNDVGPQNTGNPQDYIYDAASLNPSETDVALQGDGTNDDSSWHHVALSFDETSGEVKIYFDYLLAQARTLADTEADGYTHPGGGLRLGKFSAEDYGLLLDELRYSNTVLTPGSFLREAPVVGESDTVAHWRMEDAEASEGAAVTSVANSASAVHVATARGGTPTYSADVPGTTIIDPRSGASYPNQFSLDSSSANARVGADNDAAFDTSFTVEMFIKLGGEPAGFETFLRRRQLNDQRWHIDFDHGNKGSFGRMRCRFDTPANGVPDDVAEVGVDENVNFVLGATGGTAVPEARRIWIDTDPGDGLLASYDDPTDWALDGDGLNDAPGWHHIALTCDETTSMLAFYYDYELMQTRTLADSAGDGYTHPAGLLEFGKFSSTENGLLIDEVRYSGAVLRPFEFLQATSAPELPLAILALQFDPGANEVTLQWRSKPGLVYAVERSSDLLPDWFELIDDVPSDGETTSFTDDSLPAATPRAYYRVREIP